MKKTVRYLWSFLGIILMGILVYRTGIKGMDAVQGMGEDKKNQKAALCINTGEIRGSLSPLENERKEKEQILSLCFANLLERDSKGRIKNKKASETFGKNEKQVAHISWGYDTIHKHTVITIVLNPYAKTADGQRITAKDILFNFYLRSASVDYAGSKFLRMEILGQKEYAFGTKDVKKRENEIKKYVKNPTETMKKRWREEIVRVQLQNELNWIKSLYQDSMYDFVRSKYQEPKDLFAYYYSYQTNYKAAGKKEQQVLEEILRQYDWHFERLEKVTNKSYTVQAKEIVLGEILKNSGKDTVKYMEGIRQINERKVSVVLKGKKENWQELCAMWLLPMGKYGESKEYNGKDNFGFFRTKVREIYDRAGKEFGGYGSYYSEKINEDTIVLKWNQAFVARKPGIEKIIVNRSGYQSGEQKQMVKDLLEGKVHIIFTEQSSSFNKYLNHYSTGAIYRIREKNWKEGKIQKSMLYRTDYVNAPSIWKINTGGGDLFQNIEKVRINE